MFPKDQPNAVVSGKKVTGITTSNNGVRFQYWLCILVHAIVVLVRAAMVVVWAMRLDHRWTFRNSHISASTYILNFTTTVYALSVWICGWYLHPVLQQLCHGRTGVIGIVFYLIDPAIIFEV
jgi:hypothetical protein